MAFEVWSWTSNISIIPWVGNAKYQVPPPQLLWIRDSGGGAQGSVLLQAPPPTWFWCRLTSKSQWTKHGGWLSQENNNFTSRRVWPTRFVVFNCLPDSSLYIFFPLFKLKFHLRGQRFPCWGCAKEPASGDELGCVYYDFELLVTQSVLGIFKISALTWNRLRTWLF